MHCQKMTSVPPEATAKVTAVVLGAVPVFTPHALVFVVCVCEQTHDGLALNARV
jgi:hypothetical protein